MAKSKRLPPCPSRRGAPRGLPQAHGADALCVAHACGVPRTRIERLAREETPVTADTALRLARYFGTTAGFWMGIQTQYDLERAQDELNGELERIAPVKQVAA
jgi:antitoxin HigA-1